MTKKKPDSSLCNCRSVHMMFFVVADFPTSGNSQESTEEGKEYIYNWLQSERVLTALSLLKSNKYVHVLLNRAVLFISLECK